MPVRVAKTLLMKDAYSKRMSGLGRTLVRRHSGTHLTEGQTVGAGIIQERCDYSWQNPRLPHCMTA